MADFLRKQFCWKAISFSHKKTPYSPEEFVIKHKNLFIIIITTIIIMIVSELFRFLVLSSLYIAHVFFCSLVKDRELNHLAK